MPENPEQRSFVSFCDLTNAEIGSKVDSLIAENTKLKGKPVEIKHIFFMISLSCLERYQTFYCSKYVCI